MDPLAMERLRAKGRLGRGAPGALMGAYGRFAYGCWGAKAAAGAKRESGAGGEGGKGDEGGAGGGAGGGGGRKGGKGGKGGGGGGGWTLSLQAVKDSGTNGPNGPNGPSSTGVNRFYAKAGQAVGGSANGLSNGLSSGQGQYSESGHMDGMVTKGGRTGGKGGKGGKGAAGGRAEREERKNRNAMFGEFGLLLRGVVLTGSMTMERSNGYRASWESLSDPVGRHGRIFRHVAECRNSLHRERLGVAAFVRQLQQHAAGRAMASRGASHGNLRRDGHVHGRVGGALSSSSVSVGHLSGGKSINPFGLPSTRMEEGAVPTLSKGELRHILKASRYALEIVVLRN